MKLNAQLSAEWYACIARRPFPFQQSWVACRRRRAKDRNRSSESPRSLTFGARPATRKNRTELEKLSNLKEHPKRRCLQSAQPQCGGIRRMESQGRQRPDLFPFIFLLIHMFAGGVASPHLIFPWAFWRQAIFEGVVACTVRSAGSIC